MLLFVGCNPSDDGNKQTNSENRASVESNFEWPQEGFFATVPKYGKNPDSYTFYENRIFSQGIIGYKNAEYEEFYDYCKKLGESGFSARAESDRINDEYSLEMGNMITYRSVENDGIWVEVIWENEPSAAYRLQIISYDSDPLEQKQAA